MIQNIALKNIRNRLYLTLRVSSIIVTLQVAYKNISVRSNITQLVGIPPTKARDGVSW